MIIKTLKLSDSSSNILNKEDMLSVIENKINLKVVDNFF